MTTRNFSAITLPNTPENQAHANYLNRPFSVSESGKTIKIELAQNEYMFASTPAKLKEALGF